MKLEPALLKKINVLQSSHITYNYLGEEIEQQFLNYN